MNIDINDEILYKYLAGTATVYEKASLKEWLKSSDNQEYFYAVLIRWEQLNPQFTPNVDQAIVHHFSRINAKAFGQELPVNKSTSPHYHWLVAASIVLFFGILFWFQRDTIRYKTYQTAFDQKQTFQLDDGSRITLHANSSLLVPRFGFGTRSRDVFLEGEAEFSIVHTSNDQQFIVKTGNQLDIVVLGTEFSVFSRKHGAKVLLHKGKVQLRYQQGPDVKEVWMKPGDLVLMDPKRHLVQTTVPEIKKITAWKEHHFVFEETTLQEICLLFREQFGVDVTIAHDSLAVWTVTGSFSAQTAEEMLETITEAANLKYRKETNSILIYTD